jgi:dihydropteroate synthase
MEYTLNIRGRLVELEEPQVMGILNATPDSFYANSRMQTEEDLANRTKQIITEGGTMIDVGACSTRPGANMVSAEEEMERLRKALPVIQNTKEQIIKESEGMPYPIVSVDTFRPEVARMAVEEFGVDMVNDVSEGTPEMFRMVARLRVPYILTSVQADLRGTLMAFATKVQQLRDYGQKDIILDPGFGFGKTLDDNYQLMNQLEKMQVMELPLLVGVSRKTMIWKLLDCTPDEALNGTTVLHTIALMKGASILRVHDVKQATECVKIVRRLKD